MITTCSKCGTLYRAGSEEQAYEPDRECRECYLSGVRAAERFAEQRDQDPDFKAAQDEQAIADQLDGEQIDRERADAQREAGPCVDVDHESLGRGPGGVA